MTQHSTARRLATASSGTLLLCLLGATPALAATAPADGSLVDPVATTVATTTSTVTSTTSTVTGTVTSILPSPTTSPTPTASPTSSPLPSPGDAVSTLTSTVDTATQQVGQLTGVSPSASPLPTGLNTDSGTATHNGGSTSGSSGSGTSGGSGTAGGSGSGSTGRRVGGSGATASSPAMWPSVQRARTARLEALAGMVPSVATPQQAMLAAGESPALASPPHPLFPGSGDGNAPRGLFIAVATMVIGALTAAHVKSAQDRLARPLAH